VQKIQKFKPTFPKFKPKPLEFYETVKRFRETNKFSSTLVLGRFNGFRTIRVREIRSPVIVFSDTESIQK